MDKLGEPEIENLKASVGGQAKICRLQVAMDDALRMRGPQALRKLQSQANHLVRGDRTGGQLLIECVPRDVFRDQKVGFIRGIEIVDRRDVGMVQLGERQRFLAESFPGIFVGKSAGRENFYGDITLQLLVVRKEDHSHPARANLLHDAVVAKIFPSMSPNTTGMLSRRAKRVNHHELRRGGRPRPPSRAKLDRFLP